MTRHEALERLKFFIKRNLRAKESSSYFFKIDGSRICERCRTSKRRTLYMIINEESPVLLKCFRASCSMEYFEEHPNADVNKARPITAEELKAFGFDDAEATALILDTTNLIYSRSVSIADQNLLIENNFLSNIQRAYLKVRCRLNNLSSYDLQYYHLISDVNKVIEDNDITSLDEQLERAYAKYTKNNSITFECSENTLMTRAIDDKKILQKSIVNINQKASSLGYRIGPKSKDAKTLVVAEGIFDIINAEKYFAILKDAVYVATLGFNKTLSIIEYYYYQNIDTMDRLIIFMDSDVVTTEFGKTRYTYNRKQLYNLIKSLELSLGIGVFNKISVAYNTSYKDLGDFSKPITPKAEDINISELYSEFEKYKHNKILKRRG